MKRWLIAGAVSYALIGVVTFGHAAASLERLEDAAYAECLVARKDAVTCRFLRDAPQPSVAFAALLWPLYWSWEAWS